MPVKAGARRRRRVVRAAVLGAAKACCSRRRRGFARTYERALSRQPVGRERADRRSVQLPGHANTADTPSRRKIFVCRPKDAASEEPCATTDSDRRWRRGVSPAGDRSRMSRRCSSFYRSGRATAGSRRASSGAGAHAGGAEFLFRVEREPAGIAGTPYRLSDLELASRLSFFLWSSIPDDELLDCRQRGQAAGSRGARAAGSADARRSASRGARRQLRRAVAAIWASSPASYPTRYVFPEFDENLREALLEETELFVEVSSARIAASLDLLTANYTFVNERLARHYGIPDVYGNQFRRVTFRTASAAGCSARAAS